MLVGAAPEGEEYHRVVGRSKQKQDCKLSSLSSYAKHKLVTM